MRQRAMIAMALACRPSLLLADEPTTALDVTVQAQILAAARRLAGRDSAWRCVFVTHDLGAGRRKSPTGWHVMYAGQIVETGDASTVLEAPKHPYTRALLECLPVRHLPRDRTTWHDLPTQGRRSI